MADETGQVEVFPAPARRVFSAAVGRLVTLTTDLRLAQDILSCFATIADALPPSSWRFLPFRWRLLLMAFSVVCVFGRVPQIRPRLLLMPG